LAIRYPFAAYLSTPLGIWALAAHFSNVVLSSRMRSTGEIYTPGSNAHPCGPRSFIDPDQGSCLRRRMNTCHRIHISAFCSHLSNSFSQAECPGAPKYSLYALALTHEIVTKVTGDPWMLLVILILWRADQAIATLQAMYVRTKTSILLLSYHMYVCIKNRFRYQNNNRN
jgi:hypothetical protein